MTGKINTTTLITVLLLVTQTITGCTAAIIGTATVTTIAGVANRQERSIGIIVDDTIIKAKIKNKFRKADFKNLFLVVSVKSVDRSVVLTGVVDDPKLRVDAVRLAWSVKGVKTVSDEIQISSKHQNDSYFKDAAITVSIKSKLILNKYIKSLNYNIQTVNGIVYVIGIAKNQDELDLVLDIVSRASGVKKVINYVEVRDEDDERG